MLLSLSIKNYLLIDHIDLSFKEGFSVITGETGSGKSIILGAISLLLGKRADSVIMPDKNSKCIIEACFDISKQDIKSLFNDLDIDFDNITLIRREILSNGKSRAFVNDTPVNLSDIKLISEKLIDLHSQHENIALSAPNYRLQIIDTIAGTTNLYAEYRETYNTWNNTKQELKNSLTKLEKAKRDVDYYKFQVDQITSAKLEDNNELEYLEVQSSLLENAEEIKESMYSSLNILDGNENSVENSLREIKSFFTKIIKSYKPAEDIVNRIESLIIEIRDINNLISDEAEKAESNPELLQKINSRIDLINNLLLKHNAKNIEELKNKCSEYYNHIQNTEDIENKIEILTKTEQIQYEKANKLAAELSKTREKSFGKIEKHIQELLKELGIEHGIFTIKNNHLQDISIYGLDDIDFLFSANKSIDPQILEKVASGGEFSRLMLAIKSVIADASNIPTIIFDEIDTGVSGEIASKMGKIMKKLSEKFQVISITHLPQVAAFGNTHYKVYKDSSQNRSITNIKVLSGDEKITEIASMISGESLSPQAIENAKILIKNN
ncbi:MAG: DNA repair protein RecN [Bacteroidales bacterium]|jgi:DNA repair protein RecN (Recombination protein N)|nr:DNA repair protein RecN [Bacteroidales bacterium]